MDGCFVILGLFILSLIIAAVGHLIWLVYAAIFRALGGGSQRPSRPEASVEQQVHRLYQRGLIDRDTLERVVAAIRNDAIGAGYSSTVLPRMHVEPLTAREADRLGAAVEQMLTAPASVLPIEQPTDLRPPPPLVPIRPPPPPMPPPPPPRPRRPWNEVLAAFMKEANIRWGELVGGLLIIGCSIALVRTFWSSIADHTWLKLNVFTAITAIVFGIGLYTEHRWKLPTTSRAILIIASLLVPLTFFAVLARSTGALTILELGGTLLALGIFGYLLWASGRVLFPEYPWMLLIGVLGPSAAQVVLSRLDTATPMALLIGSAIPLAFYVTANVRAALSSRHETEFEESLADHLLMLLGITTFAAGPAVFQLIPAGRVAAAMETLSLLFPIAAIPSLLVGILLWGRLTSKEALTRRLIGATVALLGVGLLFAAVIIAYPQPHASIYCGMYALAAFAIAYVDQRAQVTRAAAGLLLLSLFLWPDINYSRDAGTIALVHASLCLIAAIALKRYPDARSVFTEPLASAALVVSVLALAHSFFRLPPDFGLASISRTALTIHLFWVTGMWLAAALVLGQAAVLGISQVLLAVSVISAAWAISGAPIPSLAALRDAVLGLAALGFADSLVRRYSPPWLLRLKPPGSAFDPGRFHPCVALAGLAVLALTAVMPGVIAEFSHVAWTPGASPLLAVWTWLIPLLLAGSLVLRSPGRPALLTDISLVLTLLLALPLAAAHMAGSSASASAWRWLSVAAMLGLSIPAWFNFPRPVRETRWLFLPLTLVPILILTIHPSILTFSDRSFVGPAQQTIFAQLGATWNYIPPLLLSVAILVVHALKDHSSNLALAAGLVLNLTISLGYALHISTSGQAFTADHLVRLLQFNFLATAVFAAAWLLILQRRKEPVGWPIVVELSVALFPLVILLAIAEARLLVAPVSLPAWARLIADPIGIPAALGLAVVGLWIQRRMTGRISTTAVVLSLMLIGTLSALAAWSWGSWTAIHVLMVLRMIAGWMVLQLGWLLARSMAMPDIAVAETPAHGAVARLLGWERVGHNITAGASILGGFPIVVGLMTVARDPSGAAWTVAAMLSAAALAGVLSIWTLRSAMLMAMGLLLNLAASFWWQYHLRPGSHFELIYLNALALSGGGLIALGIELMVLRPLRGDVVRRGAISWQVLACIFSTLAVAGLTLLRFVGAVPLLGFGAVDPTLLWMSLLTTSLLAALCLYDEDAWCVIPSLYVLGLVWIGQSYDLLRPLITVRLWHAVAALGGYSVLVGLIYNLRANLVPRLTLLGVPRRDGWPSASPGWLTWTTFAITAVVALLAVPHVLLDRAMANRQATAAAAVCMAVAIGLLGAEKGRTALKTSALVVGALGAVLWSLAWISPGHPDTLLNWMVTSMVALSVLTVLFAIASRRLLSADGEWSGSARQLVPLLGSATGLMLPAILGFEFYEYQPNPPVPIMAAPAFIVIALTFLFLSVGCFLCAFRPSLDPLRLPERSRTGYVYAAQILIGLIFLHARLVHPEWFGRGFFVRNWPLILLGVAFANLAISEWLRRREMHRLAEPFTNVGAFLPFMLVGGFGVLDGSRAVIGLSLALLLIALMYAAMAWARRSFIFSVLALAAANGAVWKLLHTVPSFAFFEHPQLWLIPPALSALAAAYLNRDRLTAEQMSTIRYVSLFVIYLSSTADIWINLQSALVLALILAGLSAAGVFIGIAARVQSFLFLGIAFTFVAVAAMIRVASQQVQANWPWLVAGILFGAAIVVTFALFEKKRAEMLGMLEQLKEWQK